jgi:DNA-binding LacI/PurR family transcriptional regulator
VDVARHAGVSQSVVSRTFARGPTQSKVSEAMRRKVLAAAEELGYRPNAFARSLITRRSHLVALLFSYLDNPFYAMAMEQFCLALQEQAYHPLVLMMPDTLVDAEHTINELLQYQVDGIVTASVELSSGFCEDCLRQGIPVVMFNRTQDQPRLCSVTTDNVGGGRLAARYLLAGGHQRIALIAGWEGASTSRDREAGFVAELAQQGGLLFARGVGHFHLPRTVEATRAMFGVAPAHRPDAVFVVNDYMALAVLDVLRSELGLRVPDDVSVIGFDDTAMAALPTYALTTIRQPVEQMVRATMRVLFENIAARGMEAEHLQFEARLVERASARRPVQSVT